MEKTYANSLAGYKKWDKDHPWNASYPKQYKEVAGVYVELSMNEFGGELACFTAVREYDREKKTFKTVWAVDCSEAVVKTINELTEKFAERHKCKYLNYMK